VFKAPRQFAKLRELARPDTGVGIEIFTGVTPGLSKILPIGTHREGDALRAQRSRSVWEAGLRRCRVPQYSERSQTALAPLLMRHRAHMQRWGCRRTKKAEPTAAYSSGLVTRNLERWVMLASDWPIAVKKLLSVGR